MIAINVILAGWKFLGSMRGWVPTVAIFTLVQDTPTPPELPGSPLDRLLASQPDHVSE